MNEAWQRPRPGTSVMDMALSRQEFGRRMRAARQRANLTQQDVADRMGVAWRQAQKWDSGNVLPRANRIPQIAEILGVDVAYLQEPVDEHTVDRTARLVQENAVALRTTLSLLDELLHEVRANRKLAVDATAQVTTRLEALEARAEAGSFSAAQLEVLRLAGVQLPPPEADDTGSTKTRRSK